MTTAKSTLITSVKKRMSKPLLLGLFLLMNFVSGLAFTLHANPSQQSAYPQWRQNYLKRLQEAETADRPLLMRQVAQEYFRQAAADRAFPLMGEGLAYMLRAQMKVAPDSLEQYETYINQMDSVGHSVSTRSICHLLRGNSALSMLNTVPQLARQSAIEQILNDYRQALASDHDDHLMETSAQDFVPMIQLGTLNQEVKSYPLYGVIGRNVIGGMEQLYRMSASVDERHALLKEMSAIYNHWLTVENNHGDSALALMVRMDYYHWAKRYHYELDQIDFPYPTSPTLEEYKQNVLLPELYFFLADELLEKKNATAFKTAIDYYQTIIKKYPTYHRTPNAVGQVYSELAPSFDLRVNRVFATTDSIKIHLSYRNVNAAELLLSAQDSPQGKWTKRIPLTLASVEDGTVKDTLITLAPCPYGRYSVRYKIHLSKPYKERSTASKETSLMFCVSDLMVHALHYPDGNTQLRLLDKYRGAPVSGGTITLTENNQQQEVQQSFVTDKNGVVMVPRKLTSLKVKATYQHDIYGDEESIYNGNIYLPKEKAYRRATLLTDRKLYRPGDVVTVTAVAYNRTSDEAHVLEQFPMAVQLISPNGKVLQTVEGTTDAHGVVALTFTLPEEMMKGTCQLRTNQPSGYASIRVEEYVAPTYDLTFTQLADTLTLPRMVTATVQTKLLSDIPLKEVTLNYTLTGRPYPLFWGREKGFYYPESYSKPQIIAQGQALTDAQGKGVLTLAVDSLQAIQSEYATYSLSVVAVSPTGERHEAVRSFVGYYPAMKVDPKDDDPASEKELATVVPDSLRLPLWIAPGDLKFSQERPAVLRIHTNIEDALVHIRYLTTQGVIAERDVEVKDSLYLLQLPYEERYGKALTVQCSLIKEGAFYKQVKTLFAPLPEKRLQLKWKTFRDHLLPGQKEKFELQVLTPTGQPADATLWMTMYDASTDAIAAYKLPALLRYYHEKSTIYEFQGRIDRSYAGLQLDWPENSYVSLDFDALISPLGIDSSVATYGRNLFVRRMSAAQGGNDGKVFKIRGSASLASVPSSTMEMESVPSADEQLEASSDDGLRKKLLTTAFCYPRLTTDSLGNITIPFEVPGDLTRWHMLGLVHTSDMMQGKIDTVLVSQRPLMVTPTKPRFLRVGDKASLAVTVSNLLDKKEKTKVKLTLFDASTKKPLQHQVRTIRLAANGQQEVTFQLQEITQSGEILCRIEASNRAASDGEQFLIAVEDNTNKVVHSQPFLLMPGDSVVWKQPMIQGQVEELTHSVHLTQGILFTALQQLPRIWQAGGEVSTTDLLNRYYALLMGRYLIDKQPALQAWVTDRAQSGMMIHRQADALTMSPWEVMGDQQVEYWQRLASEMETNRANYLTADYRAQLMSLQQADGSFVWYPGMKSSLYATSLVVNQLLRFEQLVTAIQGDPLLTEASQANRAIILKAKKWLDSQATAYVRALQSQAAEGLSDGKNRLAIPAFYPLQYLCIDSQLADWTSLDSLSDEARYLVDHMETDARKLSLSDKLNVATIYLALHQMERAQTMMASIHEYALYSEQPAILSRAMRLYAQWKRVKREHGDTEPGTRNRDEVYLKALSMARTRQWYQPTAQADILAALLTDQTWKLPQGTVSFFGAEPIVFSQASLAPGFVDKVVKVSTKQDNRLINQSNEVLWGSFVTSYGQENSQQSVSVDSVAVGQGLTMTRTLYLMDDSGDIAQAKKLTPGMAIPQGSRLTVLLQIAAPTNLDMVRIQDHFGAGLMPVNQRSGYQWGTLPQWLSDSWLRTRWAGAAYRIPNSYYEVDQSSVCFYINQLERGKYSLQYQLVAQQRGVFQGTTAEMVSLFAPDYHVVVPIAQVHIMSRDDK